MVKSKLLLFDYHAPTEKGYPIKISITDGVSKKRKYINLKYYAFDNEWSKELCLPLKDHPDFMNVLELVYDYKFRIEKANKLSKDEKWTIEKMYRYFSQDEHSESFFTYAEHHISRLKQNGRKSTAAKKQQALNSFKTFNLDQDLTFDQITAELLKQYRDDCLSSGRFKPSGVHTYLRALRSIYNEKQNSTAPFKGIMPKLNKTMNKNISAAEMAIVLQVAEQNIDKAVNSYQALTNYIDYFALCFLLGGIDLIDLANLEYGKHLKGGRVVFMRFKGGSNEWINNMVPDVAFKILQKYRSDNHTFLVPIHTASNYKNFYSNYNSRIKTVLQQYKIESYVTSKTPRYTFINIAKEIGVPRDITEEIVGHARKDVHSIYESGHSNEVRDKAQISVIENVLVKKKATEFVAFKLKKDDD
jgi:hypothetical protein